MTRFSATLLAGLTVGALALAGCNKEESAAPTATASGTSAAAEGSAPVFSLAWSEYPSWSTFGVAEQLGLIDGAEGKMGTAEKAHNVDIVLREADYDTCLQLYGAGTVDAVCMTNMDALAPSLGRASVAVLPTSTSDGGDALIVTGPVTDVKQLKGKPIRGLEKSVSEYFFTRGLQARGEKPADYDFTNMDPGAAATAMQTGKVDAIVVWNPFILQTLKTTPDAKVLFDSSVIPGEIIDMVVVAKGSLEKPGGDRFAKAVVEAFYDVSDRIENPKTRDETLVALGAKFSSLNAEQMADVVTKTKFYKTPAAARELFDSETLKQTMGKVTSFAKDAAMVDALPTIAYGKPEGKDVQLRFDTQYLPASK